LGVFISWRCSSGTTPGGNQVKVETATEGGADRRSAKTRPRRWINRAKRIRIQGADLRLWRPWQDSNLHLTD
jgi:hypothetical protein